MPAASDEVCKCYSWRYATAKGIMAAARSTHCSRTDSHNLIGDYLVNKLLLGLLISLAVSGTASAAGAIAVIDDKGDTAKDVGYAVGRGDTQDKAAKDAFAECKKADMKGCKIAVKYDECGAYASSKERFGIGDGSTEAEAKKTALKNCGNTSCRIVISDCS